MDEREIGEERTMSSESSNDNSDDTPGPSLPTGLTIHVTAETNAGGRRHMEDFLAVKLSPDERYKEIPYLREQAYFGVFDGHGGREAARFARDRLWDVIQDNPKFQMPDADNICDGVTEAFEAVHKEMEPLRGRPQKRVCVGLWGGGPTKNGAQIVTTISI
jgi:serine/threonine protein phosphatase PrpC